MNLSAETEDSLFLQLFSFLFKETKQDFKTSIAVLHKVADQYYERPANIFFLTPQSASIFLKLAAEKELGQKLQTK